MADVKSYLAGKKNCGLEVGDCVRVTRVAEDHENGWNNVWPKIVQAGWVGRITDDGWEAGYRVDFGEPINDWWGLPYFVLEKVEATEDGRAIPAKSDTEFKVGDYVRIVRKPYWDEAICWNDAEMDCNVGKVGRVLGVMRNNCIVHVFGGNNNARLYNGFVYPAAVLEKCEKPAGVDDTPIELEKKGVFDMIADSLKDHDKKLENTKPVFDTEDKALDYAKRLAALKSGDVVQIDHHGNKLHAVFTGYADSDGDPILLAYNPDDKKLHKTVAQFDLIILPD